MKGPLVDQDTLNWLFRLGVIGTILIALFSLFDSTPFIVRALGNLLILGSLLFLADVEAGKVFKQQYWIVLAIWIVVIVHSGIGFLTMGEEGLKVFQTITFFIYAAVLVSVPLFTEAMKVLSMEAQGTDIGRIWKILTIISAVYYLIPTVAFVGIFLGRLIGVDVGLSYGVDETSAIPKALVMYTVRAMFFLPPVLVLAALHKTRMVLPTIFRIDPATQSSESTAAENNRPV